MGNMTPEAMEKRRQSYLKHKRSELGITCNVTDEQLKKDPLLYAHLEHRIDRYHTLTAELASFPLNDAMAEDLVAIILDNVKESASAVDALKVGDTVEDGNAYGDVFEQKVVSIDKHNRCYRTFEPGIKQYSWRSINMYKRR